MKVHDQFIAATIAALHYEAHPCERLSYPCPLCGELVYDGMQERHEAKDHNVEDELIARMIDLGVTYEQIVELVYG